MTILNEDDPQRDDVEPTRVKGRSIQVGRLDGEQFEHVGHTLDDGLTVEPDEKVIKLQDAVNRLRAAVDGALVVSGTDLIGRRPDRGQVVMDLDLCPACRAPLVIVNGRLGDGRTETMIRDGRVVIRPHRDVCAIAGMPGTWRQRDEAAQALARGEVVAIPTVPACPPEDHGRKPLQAGGHPV